MMNRFIKLREQGSKGEKHNPLHLDEFQWESEWVDAGCEPVHEGDAAADATIFNWRHVAEARGAPEERNLRRTAAVQVGNSGLSYTRRLKRARTAVPGPSEEVCEDQVLSDQDVEEEAPAQQEESQAETESEEMDEDREDGGGTGGGFRVDDALL